MILSQRNRAGARNESRESFTTFYSARLAIVFCIVLSISVIPASNQEVARLGQAFHLVNAKNVETLQRELDRASDEGYVVTLAWPAYNLVLLRKRAESEPRHEYRVFDGDKAIEQIGAEGYRALPDTLDVNGGALRVIAQKFGEAEHYQSLLIRTNRTSTLDKNIQEAVAKGFRIIGMASDDSGHAALLERPASGSFEAGGASSAVCIAASGQDALQKELSARAAAGYHLVQSSSWKETLLSLERRDANKVEYRVLSTTKSGTLEKEINAATAQGFRYTPGTLHAIQKGIPMLGRTGSEYVAIMEKGEDDARREYSIVGAKRMGTLIREFDEAVAKGLVPVALSLGYSDQETLVLFERTKQ